MSLFDLGRVPSVPLDFMDGDHRQEASLLNDLADGVTALRSGERAEAAVRERFAALFTHTQEWRPRNRSRRDRTLRAGRRPFDEVDRS